MKIKCFPKPVLNLRELNSCQSCIHRYKLAKAQVEGWSPSGQHSRGNYMFLMLGIWHFIPSEFTARPKAPEQKPDLELFKSPDLLSMVLSSTAFICWNIVKTSSCESWVAVCASRHRDISQSSRFVSAVHSCWSDSLRKQETNIPISLACWGRVKLLWWLNISKAHPHLWSLVISSLHDRFVGNQGLFNTKENWCAPRWRDACVQDGGDCTKPLAQLLLLMGWSVCTGFCEVRGRASLDCWDDRERFAS